MENESILTSIKKLLGITEECTDFDKDIIIDINSVLMILTQLGIGPPEGFTIVDSTATWSEFVSNIKQLAAVKTFVHLKVRLIFDPPMSTAVLESMKEIVKETEWRLTNANTISGREVSEDESK